MAEVSSAPLPILTETVNQQFFLEELGGPQNPQSYLENFPETLYTRNLNSNLVSLLYALLGPAGLGWLRRNYLVARLEAEAAGLSLVNLNQLYSNIFGFTRLAEETYTFIPEDLLSHEEWERIQVSDASYRGRALAFLGAVRAGNTPLGIELAAESGLNRPVDIVENYRYLYDVHSDKPIGLKYYGKTRSTEEVIILPRQVIPTGSVQTIYFSGTVAKGHFKIGLNVGSVIETTAINIEPVAELENNMRKALEALPSVGKNGVEVRKGVETNSLEIIFVNSAATEKFPQVSIIPTIPLETSGKVPVTAEVILTKIGSAAEGQERGISPQDWYYANKAVDQIRPYTAIVTPSEALTNVKVQPINLVYSDSIFTEVLRYVRGSSSVEWPEGEAEWIRQNEELEAPKGQHDQTHHYTNFHNFPENGIKASGETQLRNVHRGPFSGYETLLFPFLKDYENSGVVFKPEYALGEPVEPLFVSSIAKKKAFLNRAYPSTYHGLPGATKPIVTQYFWASEEKVSGADYLHLDLKTTQAINYLTFEATNKPYDITISYDLLDEEEEQFEPVTFSTREGIGSSLSLGHGPTEDNPWVTCSYYFTDSLNHIIFARRLRITLTRRPGTPYVLTDGTSIPFGIEVRGLRMGRSI